MVPMMTKYHFPVTVPGLQVFFWRNKLKSFPCRECKPNSKFMWLQRLFNNCSRISSSPKTTILFINGSSRMKMSFITAEYFCKKLSSIHLCSSALNWHMYSACNGHQSPVLATTELRQACGDKSLSKFDVTLLHRGSIFAGDDKQRGAGSQTRCSVQKKCFS